MEVPTFWGSIVQFNKPYKVEPYLLCNCFYILHIKLIVSHNTFAIKLVMQYFGVYPAWASINFVDFSSTVFIGRLYCHIAVGNSQAWIFILGVLGGQLIFFGPGIFWVLLKTLGILRGLDFCLHLIILVVCNIPPLGLYQTLYVVFHSTVEKLEPMWKSFIVLYFFNPLLCTEYSITMLHVVFVITTWNLFWNFLFPCNVLYLFCINEDIGIGNGMIFSDIWHKYLDWYFKIVIRNFKSR